MVVIELEQSEYTFSEEDGAVPVCAVLHGELGGLITAVAVNLFPDSASSTC